MSNRRSALLVAGVYLSLVPGVRASPGLAERISRAGAAAGLESAVPMAVLEAPAPIPAFPFSSLSRDPYTREELERMSKEELVNLIIFLQRGDGPPERETCSLFDPMAGQSGQVIYRYNHPGYSDDGTLKWPDGQTFMRRNSGYTNDMSLFYADGSPLLIRNSGYTNDRTIKWPTGHTLLLRNSGYVNDGSIFRADGSQWLVRNSGYSNDRQRHGPPVEQYRGANYTAHARLTPSDSVKVSIIQRGSGWRTRVEIDAENERVRVTECLVEDPWRGR